MSGTEMANDINKAIASGGYVIVPEKAVDGTGRNAIYVYMTYDGQTGAQSWKISGGLNGGFLSGLFIGLATSLLIGVVLASIVPLLAAIAAGTGILAALTPLLVGTIFLLTSFFASYVVLPEMGLECYEEGRAIGSILGGFTNFFVGGYKTIKGLIGMLAGVNWNSFILDKSDGLLFNNISKC